MSAQPTWEQFDALYARIDRAEAALAVAREREQRAVKTAERLRERWDLAHRAIRGGLPEAHYLATLRALESRDLADDAALVDEPAAATSSAWSAGGDFASAAADEPGAPTRHRGRVRSVRRAKDELSLSPGEWEAAEAVARLAAADEPGETPA